MASRVKNLLSGVSKTPLGILTFQFANHAKSEVQRLALWGLPLGIGALWFIWPALTDNFRESVGLAPAVTKAPPQIKFQLEDIDKMPTTR